VSPALDGGRPEGEPSFEGFVTGGAATTLPSQFFVELLPAIADEAELRVTLYALYAIGKTKGGLRAVRASELAGETPLVRALEAHGGAEAVRPALARAAERGTFLGCPLSDGDMLYAVHNEAGRRVLERVRAGALAVPGARAVPWVAAERAVPARVYEQEIGALSPSIAEALNEAVERYPEAWIVEALRMAATHNARSWAYAEAILKRWESEGRARGNQADTAGTGGADASAGRGVASAARRDHGPYDHLVRRA
jgi:DnaD/phage-associated family protein